MEYLRITGVYETCLRLNHVADVLLLWFISIHLLITTQWKHF